MSLISCGICGNEKNNHTLKVKEAMFGLGDEFSYFQCSECGCLQISEIPANMAKFYPPEYYSFSRIHPIPGTSFVKSLIKPWLQRERARYAVFGHGGIGKLIYTLFPDYIAMSLSGTRLKQDDGILDVGCGSGSFLYFLKELGFKNLLGLDAFIESNIIYPNKLRIQKGSLESVDGKWKLIMFNHSFEHVPNQKDTLKFVSKLLAPAGVCIINMPTVSSYAWETYRKNWVQLDAPRHFFLHSINSIRLLAEKVGLELRQVVYNSTAFQFWGSEQYIRGNPLILSPYLRGNPLITILSISKFRRLSRKAEDLNQRNQGDQAAFYLTKMSDKRKTVTV